MEGGWEDGRLNQTEAGLRRSQTDGSESGEFKSEIREIKSELREIKSELKEIKSVSREINQLYDVQKSRSCGLVNPEDAWTVGMDVLDYWGGDCWRFIMNFSYVEIITFVVVSGCYRSVCFNDFC